jgi:hypothetical protein
MMDYCEKNNEPFNYIKVEECDVFEGTPSEGKITEEMPCAFKEIPGMTIWVPIM